MSKKKQNSLGNSPTSSHQQPVGQVQRSTIIWTPIIEAARKIVETYDTLVTLRQLHYRLVAAAISGYLNMQYCYKRLSELSAELRRNNDFPRLADLTRSVYRPLSFENREEAFVWLSVRYRRDRTEGQKYQVWILYEKATLSAQIESWTHRYGIPSAALRGYSSESLEREIFEEMQSDGRPIVVFYVGDLDPEGEDIERNFLAQSHRLGLTFKHWQRLTVTPEQIEPLGLVPNFGKEKSSRAPKFIAKYGELFQIETEAIDPNVLRDMIVNAVTDSRWLNQKQLKRSLAQEKRDKREIA